MSRIVISSRYVYLAGSIEGVSEEIAENWRADARKFLSQRGIGTFDPYLAFSHPVAREHMTFIWDMNTHAILASNAVLCKLHPTARSIGSIREIQFALDHDIPVVVWDHTLVDNHSAFDLDIKISLAEACEAILGLFPDFPR